MRIIIKNFMVIVVFITTLFNPVSGFTQTHSVTLPNLEVWGAKLISDDFYPEPSFQEGFGFCNITVDSLNSKVGVTDAIIRLPQVVAKGKYPGTDIKTKKGHVKFLIGIRLNALLTEALPGEIKIKFQVFNVKEPDDEINFQEPFDITFTPEMRNEETWGLYYELPEPIELPRNARIMEEWVEISDLGKPLILARSAEANCYDEWSATARKVSRIGVNTSSFHIVEYEIPKKAQMKKSVESAHYRESPINGDY